MRRLTPIVLVAAAALGFGGCGEAALQTSKPPNAIKPARTVIFDCAGHAHSRPSELVLACADAGDELVDLQWHGWGENGTWASGREIVLTCVPNCAAGGTKSLPIVADAAGLTLSGSHAGYRVLDVNIPPKVKPLRGMRRNTRYTLDRTGPALVTNP